MCDKKNLLLWRSQIPYVVEHDHHDSDEHSKGILLFALEQAFHVYLIFFLQQFNILNLYNFFYDCEL